MQKNYHQLLDSHESLNNSYLKLINDHEQLQKVYFKLENDCERLLKKLHKQNTNLKLINLKVFFLFLLHVHFFARYLF